MPSKNGTLMIPCDEHSIEEDMSCSNEYFDVEATKEEVWKSHKNKVARFQKVILEYSKAKDYKVAIQEWEDIYGSHLSTGTCICSQNIVNLYHIHNKVTEKILIVGSECINKLECDNLEKNLKLRGKLRNYNGSKSPCLHCGTRKKGEDHWYCSKCLNNRTNSPSRVVLEEIGTINCAGLCGTLIPKLGNISKCNKCDTQSYNHCRSCGESYTSKPRCIKCYKNEMPIKCKTTNCLTMIQYTDSTFWKLLCYECSVKQPRICRRTTCNKTISKSAPSNYVYCGWACKQSSSNKD